MMAQSVTMDQFARLARQLAITSQDAVAEALTGIAYDSRDELVKQLKERLNRPRTFTTSQNAWYVTKALAGNMRAVVGLKPTQAKYLEYIFGDQETRRARDYAATKLGPAIPSARVRNAEGNFPGGPGRYLAKIIGQKGTFSGPLKTGRGFVIYQKLKRRLKAVAYILPKTSYEQQLDRAKIVEKVMRHEGVRHLNKALKKEISRKAK